MSVDYSPVAGIGINITKEQIMKTFKVEEIGFKMDNNIILLRYGEGNYTGEEDEYCMVIFDLFKNGIDGIQKTVDDFIQYLKNNNLPTEIRFISEILVC